MDFSQRAILKEWMDEPCSFEDFSACLRDLATANRMTLAYRPTIRWLAAVAATLPRKAPPLRIVDVGCGYGDMLRRIARWGRKEGIAVELTGIDLNPDAARAARAVPGSERITWLTGDAFSVDLSRGVDIVISSLFTHHLPEVEIVRFLAWMEATAQVGWFVNDLRRHVVPYWLFRALAKAMRWHRFVQHDGPVSIRRAFDVRDWERMAAAAGLPSAAVRIAQVFPARLCVGRLK